MRLSGPAGEGGPGLCREDLIMLRRWMLGLSERRWLRIALAVALLVIGLAPVGAPILSDNAFRQALRPAGVVQDNNASFAYRWLTQADGTSRIQRSQAGR